MDNDWDSLAGKIHSIVCDRFYINEPREAVETSSEVLESTSGDEVKNTEPNDKIYYFRIKLRQFIRIMRTQGIRESVYVTYRYVKRKITSHKKVKVEKEKIVKRNPEDWERKVLVFEKEENPDVSIIIPVYNKWGYTYNCLKSIQTSKKTCSFEVIIADDNSTDETAELEKYVKNVIHVRNEVNLNFLKNCNNAAAFAKGKYILFLNNDTLVKEVWLQSLYDLIESDDTIGMVGSKFIYPDGTLQEAGGIVFSNGDGKNYGRGDNPKKPEYNYVKDVDYISGASIMISRELWDELGHFDERYSPAYFEDSDLAFKVRKKGLRVVYQPKSELVHFERTSMSDNGLRLCRENRSKFMEVWADDLLRDSAPEYVQRDRSKFQKSILYIDDKVPMFDQHAGGKTTFNFLELLRDLNFKVTFIGVLDPEPYQPYTEMLQQKGIEVLYGPEYSTDIFQWLNRNANYYDIVFLNRPECAIIYLDWFKQNTRCTVAYYGHDLHWLRERREYDLTGDKRLLERSERSKETEMHIMSNSDIVMSVSPEEKTIIDKELGREITQVTPIFFYKEKKLRPFGELNKKGLLFVGGYNHSPNVDAVEWFVKEILPIVKEEIPDIDVTFAGSHPTKWIKSLESKVIHVPGYLTDEELDELYDRSLISIVPLRFGAGVKGKVVDAMYHGMPVVSTSIGIEGIPGIEPFVIPHDDAESFAKAIVDLYRERGEVERAHSRNYEFIISTFGYKSALDTFSRIFGNSKKKGTSSDGVKVLDLAYSMVCPATSGGSLKVISPLRKIKPLSDITVDIIFTTWDEEHANKVENCLKKIPVVRNAKGIVVKDYLYNKVNRPSDIPIDVWETMSLEFSDYVDMLVRQNRYDIIQIEHSQFSWLVPRIRMASPSSKIVLDAHNIEYRIYETWLPYAEAEETESIRDRYLKLKKWEETCIPWYDAAFTVSTIEEQIIKDNGLKRTYLLSTGGGVDVEKYSPKDDNREKPYDILYIGSMNWFPNANGLVWFIDEIMPIIESKRPGTNLNIIGNGKPYQKLVDLCKHKDNVKFWGFQEDDVKFFHSSKVFIVPLFIGAGARVKIVTAWASKIPIVSTTFGAEGLEAIDNGNILLRDTKEEFAEAVLQLLEKPELREKISSKAYETVLSKYTVDKCADDTVNAYCEIAGYQHSTDDPADYQSTD